MNKKTLFQNITAVFGVLCIISLVFPYYVASASATVAGQSAQASESINGISFVTECGAWGIIFAVSLAAILVFNFIKQLEQFKKLINIIGAGLMIISLFSASSIASGASGEASTAAVSVSLGHGLGFWIALLCSIGIAGVAIVNFLNLQGNPVFDAVNTSVDGEGTDGSAQSVNLSEAAEKVAGAAKNIAGTVSEKVGNLTDKAKAGKPLRQVRPHRFRQRKPHLQFPLFRRLQQFPMFKTQRPQTYKAAKMPLKTPFRRLLPKALQPPPKPWTATP